MNNHRALCSVFFVLGIALFLVTPDAHAEIESAGVFDDVLSEFKTYMHSWGDLIKSYAVRLFLVLATISLTYTFGMMLLQKADIGEFFSEFVKFLMFTGFFWWLLDNGPEFARNIIDSLNQIGSQVNTQGGLASALTPSEVVDVGFKALTRSFEQLNDGGLSGLGTGLVGALLAFGVLLMMTLIAVNMLILMVSAWVMAYAGIFFLGFGGSRWTSDMAINYYKTVLGLGAQIMTMLLLVGVGDRIINRYYEKMADNFSGMDMAVILVVAIILYSLTSKVPTMVGGLVSGAQGSVGTGTFTAGAVTGAVMGAAAMGAGTFATAANVKGGHSAVKEALGVATDGKGLSGNPIKAGGQLLSAMGTASKAAFKNASDTSGGAKAADRLKAAASKSGEPNKAAPNTEKGG